MLEEDDVIPEEFVLQESDVDPEARVTEAFLSSRRDKQNNAGMRKRRGLQGQPPMFEGSKAAAVSQGLDTDPREDSQKKHGIRRLWQDWTPARRRGL